MAITGLSYGEQDFYVCRDDPARDEDLQKARENGATIFFWGPISSRVIARIADAQTNSQVSFGDNQVQTYNQRIAYRNRECCRYGLKGWENFNDNKDRPIEFKQVELYEDGRSVMVVSDECLDRVRLATLNEVGSHIFNENTMTEPQRKNFEALSSLLGGSGATNAPNVKRTSKGTGGAKKTRSAPTKTKGTGRTRRPKSGKSGVPADQS